MLPREYEEHVAENLRKEGWSVSLTGDGPDSGVDAFARHGDRRIAVQAKMYGGSTRKINRATVMELYGVAAYFGCTGALLATDGVLREDAREAADRLGIQVRFIRSDARAPRGPLKDPLDFGVVWETYIVPLAGKTLTRTNGQTNEILRVDWSGIQRRTSNGRVGFIKIEIFRRVIERLLAGEVVTRAWINDEYTGRASSGIVLILSQVPLFETVSPLALRLRVG